MRRSAFEPCFFFGKAAAGLRVVADKVAARDQLFGSAIADTAPHGLFVSAFCEDEDGEPGKTFAGEVEHWRESPSAFAHFCAQKREGT